MAHTHETLLNNNKRWALSKLQDDPEYFTKLGVVQTPEYLWIGCSDSRVPANEVTGTHPGEIFVHRNIANLVVHTDLNVMSVVEYAVEVLKVKYIIVCGHYGCGGVRAAMMHQPFGFVDNWLRNIKDVYAKYSTELEKIADEDERANRLVEFSVIEQTRNLAKTKIAQTAWKERRLEIRAWVYDMNTGIIKDLNALYDEAEDLEPIYRYEL